MPAANDGSDYTGILSSVQTFSSGSTSNSMRCVYIMILNDNALEGNQTFNLMLNASDPKVILGRRNTTVIIIDNEG